MNSAIVESLRGELVVSCQAYPGEPLRHPEIMPRVALAAAAGGAAAVRLEGIDDIVAARRLGLSVPIVGILKRDAEGVAITPTLDDARAVADAGADIVAIDGTRRRRPDRRSLADVIAVLHRDHEVAVMADCGSVDDARHAAASGADIIGTTLAGYTGDRPATPGPDIELVAELGETTSVPIMAEGRYSTPADVRAAFTAGAFAVCVGSAITHPSTITRAFVKATVR